jgi:hypothetical protein
MKDNEIENLGTHEFLKVLTRVIKLNKELRVYTTGWVKFLYDLEEKNGTLFLTVTFPQINDRTTVSYDTKKYDKLYKQLDEAEAFLREKRDLTRRYI